MTHFERQRQMSNYQLEEYNHKTSQLDLVSQSQSLEGNNKDKKKQEHKVTI
jgi:hypothetical protein